MFNCIMRQTIINCMIFLYKFIIFFSLLINDNLLHKHVNCDILYYLNIFANFMFIHHQKGHRHLTNTIFFHGE